MDGKRSCLHRTLMDRIKVATRQLAMSNDEFNIYCAAVDFIYQTIDVGLLYSCVGI